MSKGKIFYFHAGSDNHGCEAIVRSTIKLLNERPVIISANKDADDRYGIDKIAEVHQKPIISYNFWGKVRSYLAARVFRNERYGYLLQAEHESAAFTKGTVAFSIGGDNYCYGSAYNYLLEGLNKYLHRKNIKTVLWGCSIEPSTVTDTMKRDFSKYDLIVARESISYTYLKKINENTILTCDPAFYLNKIELPLPNLFVPGKTVGINISPLIQKREAIEGLTITNYRNLIKYIIANTEYNIALIPHVVCNENDDRVPIKKLFDEFSDTERIFMVEDCNCEQLKGYISRCCMFIGARTHATIAAYSTMVPTLVIGYSTKAIGIAQDLFGTSKNYVLPVQNLKKDDDMVRAFEWLNANKANIQIHLSSVIPDYIKSILNIEERIAQL